MINEPTIEQLREAWRRARAARDLILQARTRVTDDVTLGVLGVARENAEKAMKEIEKAAQSGTVKQLTVSSKR